MEVRGFYYKTFHCVRALDSYFMSSLQGDAHPEAQSPSRRPQMSTGGGGGGLESPALAPCAAHIPHPLVSNGMSVVGQLAFLKSEIVEEASEFIP